MTRLFDLKRGDLFKVDGYEQTFQFDHMDGFYSFCLVLGEVGKIAHFAPWQKVEKVDTREAAPSCGDDAHK